MSNKLKKYRRKGKKSLKRKYGTFLKKSRKIMRGGVVLDEDLQTFLSDEESYDYYKKRISRYKKDKGIFTEELEKSKDEWVRAFFI